MLTFITRKISAAPLLLIASLCLMIGFTLGRLAPESLPKASSDVILATVGSQSITGTDFQRAWAGLGTVSDTREVRERVLKDLVERTAQVERAKSMGLGEDPDLTAQFDQLLVGRLKELELDPELAALEISPDEVAVFYEEQKSKRYTKPERRKVAVLWFDSRGQKELEERYATKLEKAVSVLRENLPSVASGFGQLALSHSEHRASRFKGGVLGWVAAENQGDKWRRQIWEIAAELKEAGDMSTIVRGEEGVFLVRLLEAQPERFAPLIQVRPDIERELRLERLRVIEDAFLHRAMAANETELFLDRLEQLDLSTEAALKEQAFEFESAFQGASSKPLN